MRTAQETKIGSDAAGVWPALSDSDYRQLFKYTPSQYMLIALDFTIMDASDAYNVATMTKCSEMIGRNIFDVFPDNPDDIGADGASNLRTSLERVKEKGVIDKMRVQKYDVRTPQGTFEERYWSAVNSPVFDAKGKLAYILHRAEDITAFVKNKHETRRETFFIRHTTSIGFILLTTLMIVVALMFYRQGDSVLKTREWLIHSYEVNVHINLLLSSLQEAELKQRAYVLSNDPAYLELPGVPSVVGERHLPLLARPQREIDMLRTLTGDNPVQQQHLVQVEEYTNELVAYIESSITQRKKLGSKTVTAGDNLKMSGELMKPIRTLITQMKVEETRLLQLRTQADDGSIANNNTIIMTAIALFYICMLGAMLMVTRHQARNRQMEGRLYDQMLEVADANRRLDSTRAFLKSMIDATPDPIYVKDQRHRWIEGNNAFWSLMGRTEKEIQGKTDYDFFPKEQAQKLWQQDEDVFTSGAIYTSEDAMVDAQGNRHILSTKKSCFKDEDGSMLLVAAVRDITELRATQDKLRESDESRLTAIMEHSGRPVYIRDLDGKYLQVNRPLLDLFRLSEKEVLGKTNYDLFSKENYSFVDEYRAHDCEVAEKGVAMEFEETAPQADGIHTFTSVKFPLFDASNKMYAICGISTDITERKYAERNKGLLAAIVESSEDAIISKSLDGIITSWNRGAEHIFGYTAEEAVGQHVKLLIPADRLEEETGIVAKLKQGEPIEHFETVRMAKNGHPVSVSLSVSPMRDEKGIIIGASKVARDITERKRSEEKLMQYTKALERSNQELDDFAYVASHDLKEPLRGLFNHASFLLEDYRDKLDDEGTHRLQRLSYLSQRMEQLVNDLLYFSRLGRTDLAVQECDPGQMIEDIRTMLESFLKERGAVIRIPKPMPKIVCDKPRITEVFRNLITNAVKYNDKKERVVEVGMIPCMDTPNGAEKAVFYVSDNGIGIDREFHQEIFRIFKRLQSSSKDKEPGTGVGLTFVKKIVERHNGRIWLESRPGKGTTFYFTVRGNGT